MDLEVDVVVMVAVELFVAGSHRKTQYINVTRNEILKELSYSNHTKLKIFFCSPSPFRLLDSSFTVLSMFTSLFVPNRNHWYSESEVMDM